MPFEPSDHQNYNKLGSSPNSPSPNSPTTQDDHHQQQQQIDEFPDNLVYFPPNEQYTQGLTITPHNPSFWTHTRTFITRKYNPGPWRYALRQVFPILKQMDYFCHRYTWSAFISDALAGGTVCTLLIPQSLSYATLAGLPPQFGLYTAFLACLVYFVFGTARETSLGPFALVSLMVSQIINELNPTLVEFETANPVEGLHLRLIYTMTLTFISGVLLLIMSVLKFGWFIDLFSSPSLQAFLQGAAFSVGATQIGALFGIQTTQGSFLITLISLFKNITTINFMTTLIGVIVVILVSCSDIYSSRKKLKVPIPAQIILVIIGTFLSWLFSFNVRFGVKVIGSIEPGFPVPTLPDWGLVFTNASYWTSAIPVAASSFVVLTSISAQMAEQFRDEYQVNYNSETLSLAISSLLGSFFNSYPSSAAYSRTTVCLACKPKTNMWNIITAIILALVIFIAGPFVYHLPKCILAAVVLASFRQSYMNWRQGVNIWKQNAAEGCVYYVTFFATILISIQAGVFAAFLASIMHIVLDQSTFIPVFLAQIPHTQRFITSTRLPTEAHDFYGFLTRVENSGGIYKVKAAEEASRARERRRNAHHTNNNTDLDSLSNDGGDNDDDNNNDDPSLPSLRNRPGQTSSFHRNDPDIGPLAHASATIRGDYSQLEDIATGKYDIPNSLSELSTANSIAMSSKSLQYTNSIDGSLTNHTHNNNAIGINGLHNIDPFGGSSTRIVGGEQSTFDMRSASMLSPEVIHPPTLNAQSDGDEEGVDLYGSGDHIHNDGDDLSTEGSIQNQDVQKTQEDQQDGVGDHDIRILILHIGAPLTFLNAAPIGDYIIRYLAMYERYCKLNPPLALSKKHPIHSPTTSSTIALPLAVDNLKAFLRRMHRTERLAQEQLGQAKAKEERRVQQLQLDEHQNYLLVTANNSPIQQSTDDLSNPSNGTPRLAPTRLSNFPSEHSTTTSTFQPHPSDIHNNPFLRHNHPNPNLIAASLTGLGNPTPNDLHPIHRLTRQHKEFLKLFNPSRLLSNQQQLLISTLLQETIDNVPDMSKFAVVIVLDYVAHVDTTALKTLYMLQKTFPELLLLFSHPGEELVEQMTLNQDKCKMTNLLFPTKQIFDSLYVAQEYSRCLLNSAEQSRLWVQKQHSSSVPFESQEHIGVELGQYPSQLPPPRQHQR